MAIVRCFGGDPLMDRYHDEEWGVPVHEERALFELLTLEGAQAGLSWLTVLRRREGYRAAFDDFDLAKIVAYDERKIEELLKDPGIIRNRAKVRTTIGNAHATLALHEAGESLDELLWGLAEGDPRRNEFATLDDLPAETEESRAMSKELKRRGFAFVGPTICYAFMQATGMVNDHIRTCFRYGQR
jgi:DNA-3-methyladenine glycosylase I